MVLYVQFPAGQFCVCARGLFLCRSPRGAVSAPARGSFSFLFSALCFSGEGEKPLLQRRCPRPLPLFQHCGLAAVLCTRAYFSLQFPAGQFCVCARGLFLCGPPQGGFCACTRSAAVCKLRGSGQFTNGYQISRLKNNNLPMAHFTFADGKILFCRLSDMNFADGQRRTCRLQIFSLPSANETFAIGKCLAGRWQISYRINGKLLVCHRQIFCLPSANFLFAIQPQICGCVPAACRAAASSSTGEEGGGRGGKNTVQRIIKKNKSPHPQADKKQAVRANTDPPPQRPAKKISRAQHTEPKPQ